MQSLTAARLQANVNALHLGRLDLVPQSLPSWTQSGLLSSLMCLGLQLPQPMTSTSDAVAAPAWQHSLFIRVYHCAQHSAGNIQISLVLSFLKPMAAGLTDISSEVPQLGPF